MIYLLFFYKIRKKLDLVDNIVYNVRDWSVNYGQYEEIS